VNDVREDDETSGGQGGQGLRIPGAPNQARVFINSIETEW
jgi:hypothetical protein